MFSAIQTCAGSTAGGGIIGTALAKRLMQHKHDVVIINSDQSVCEEIYAKYGTVTINGKATDLDVLESTKIDKCDATVAVLKNDADNLAFSLLAKHFNVKQTLVRMNDPKYENVYKIAGVTNIARATELLIDQLMVNIESPDLRKVIGVGNIDICIVNVPENSRCDGQTIASLVLP